MDPSPDDPLARIGLAEGQSAIRWWYAADPARWRWEFETVGTIIDDGVLLSVADGSDWWAYDDRSNSYQRQTIGGMLAGIPSPLSFSAPVGPANVESIDAFIEQWRERGGDFEVELAGEATVLGRRTQIVELRHPAGGLTRVFIDPERMFIMRWAVDGAGGGQSYRVEIAVLDYDTDIDATRFTFEPPPGAREAPGASNAESCSSSVGPVGLGGEAAFPPLPASSGPRTHHPATTPPLPAARTALPAAAGSPPGPCSKLPRAAISSSASASVRAVSRSRPAHGKPSIPTSLMPTVTPRTVSSASSGARAISSPSSAPTRSRSRNSCASRNRPSSCRRPSSRPVAGDREGARDRMTA